MKKINNKTKAEIEALKQKIIPIQNRIYELEKEEVMRVQRPRLSKMVGWTLRTKYEGKKDHYAEIRELIERNSTGAPEFILEQYYFPSNGVPHVSLDSSSPYLNKEWWDIEVPLVGWERCDKEEYESFKTKVLNAIKNPKAFRKYLMKR